MKKEDRKGTRVQNVAGKSAEDQLAKAAVAIATHDQNVGAGAVAVSVSNRGAGPARQDRRASLVQPCGGSWAAILSAIDTVRLRDFVGVSTTIFENSSEGAAALIARAASGRIPGNGQVAPRFSVGLGASRSGRPLPTMTAPKPLVDKAVAAAKPRTTSHGNALRRCSLDYAAISRQPGGKTVVASGLSESGQATCGLFEGNRGSFAKICPLQIRNETRGIHSGTDLEGRGHDGELSPVQGRSQCSQFGIRKASHGRRYECAPSLQSPSRKPEFSLT